MKKARIVVALGGNAILQPGQKGTAEEQYANVRIAAGSIAQLVKEGYEVVVTHGNGPQVGNILLQNEAAAATVPAQPLDICGAESQGMLGYMLQRALTNEFLKLGIKKTAVTLVTQVVVDPDDPAFQNPTKPVGPFYSAERAAELKAERGYQMKEDAGRGWRRVVPSPDPKQIWESQAVAELVAAGIVVIASGGGGIPVVKSAEGLVGVEGVIDKDLAGARLALDINADILMILTDVPQVCLNYRKENERRLSRVTTAELRVYQKEGHFAAGSMGPKVEAALRFAETGRTAVIASLHEALPALKGQAGTVISYLAETAPSCASK